MDVCYINLIDYSCYSNSRMPPKQSTLRANRSKKVRSRSAQMKTMREKRNKPPERLVEDSEQSDSDKENALTSAISSARSATSRRPMFAKSFNLPPQDNLSSSAKKMKLFEPEIPTVTNPDDQEAASNLSDVKASAGKKSRSRFSLPCSYLMFSSFFFIFSALVH